MSFDPGGLTKCSDRGPTSPTDIFTHVADGQMNEE